MLSHPALVTSEVGSDTESKAFLAEKNVSAVAGVYRPDGVVFREVADVTVFFVELCLGVKSLYVVCAVAEGFENLVAYAGHDKHIENNVN